MRWLLERKNLSVLLLLIVYSVGLVGLSIPSTRELFASLTPLNLTFSLLILLWNQERKRNFLLACGLVYMLGVLVEIAGVQSGVIFGEYYYTDLLGPQIAGAPILIGVNWLLMILSVSSISFLLSSNILYSSLIGAVLMVLMDILIEPFAIHYNLWVWENGDPPMQNYMAWFVVSLVIMLAFRKIAGKVTNPIGPWVYAIMLAFFSSLLLLNS
jgi:putative membrane protein